MIHIYNALVADDHLGDKTAAKLRVPITSHARFHEKALHHRELVCFTALMATADPQFNLPPVIPAFGRLLVTKLALRGRCLTIDQLADAASNEVEQMVTNPFQWARRWLAEFIAPMSPPAYRNLRHSSGPRAPTLRPTDIGTPPAFLHVRAAVSRA